MRAAREHRGARRPLFVGHRLALPCLLGMATAPHAHAALPESCDALGQSLVGHSCFHARHGPFVQVVASQRPDDAPPVSLVHSYYEVTLPRPSERGYVTYQVASPARAGSWAIFHAPDVPVTLLDQSGSVLPRALLVEDTGCAELPRASVFDLSPEPHWVVLGPSPRRRVPLVFEHVEDFVVRAGRDRDGDGHGSALDFVVTPCRPPAGYAPDDRDCDDTDPTRHPGARETCDGVDRNCNGIPDDTGLPCRLGSGACEMEGSWTCSSGPWVTCSARAGVPGPEECDGVDSDCDGEEDTGEDGLCHDSRAPRCVRVLGETRCGCLEDADCGGPASGRLCHDGTRRCVDGCVEVAGRNGCPPGLTCTSSDAARPGKCVDPGAAGCAGRCLDAGAEAPPDEASAASGCSCRAAPRTQGGLLLALAACLAASCRRSRR